MRGLCAVILGVLAIAMIASTGCSKNDACATSADCGSGQNCEYPVGNCAAKGQCIDPTGAGCLVITYLCGCNGKLVNVYCGDPDGYASAPTVNSSFDPTPAQANSGTCSVDQDASADAAVDE
jgi:hypothetical protein